MIYLLIREQSDVLRLKKDHDALKNVAPFFLLEMKHLKLKSVEHQHFQVHQMLNRFN